MESLVPSEYAEHFRLASKVFQLQPVYEPRSGRQIPLRSSQDSGVLISRLRTRIFSGLDRKLRTAPLQLGSAYAALLLSLLEATCLDERPCMLWCRQGHCWEFCYTGS